MRRILSVTLSRRTTCDNAGDAVLDQKINNAYEPFFINRPIFMMGCNDRLKIPSIRMIPTPFFTRLQPISRADKIYSLTAKGK